MHGSELIVGRIYEIHGNDSKGLQISKIVKILKIDHEHLLADRFGFYYVGISIEVLRDAEQIFLTLTHFLSCQPILQDEEG
ncbi:MAG: hypothetical protein UR94_C0029G0010 [Parcubacteria group bacterium GW2011_GWA2_36_10]|nr:MAG: hypothetical protein UR94_C0029G0010 [Parcubacteria group bacterium GW2011_GWA2_36_10]